VLLGIKYSFDRHVLCRRWVLVWWHYPRYQLVVKFDCFWISSFLPVLINCCHLRYVLSKFGLILHIRVNITIVLSGALSEGWSFKCACKSWSISFGIGTLGVHPNIALYGHHFIPTWSRLLFWNCTNCYVSSPADGVLVSHPVHDHIVNITIRSFYTRLRLRVSWFTMNNY
jgi:hypothetical protein